jgi:hypothetical protein
MPASAGRFAHVVEENHMDPVLAYLDAGSASLFLQLLLGGIAGVAVAAKLYWGRLLRFLRIRKPEDEAPEGVEGTPAEAAAADGSPARFNRNGAETSEPVAAEPQSR